MRTNATAAGGTAGRILWPLLAAAVGLALPGLMTAKAVEFAGAGWIVTFAVTLLLPPLAGLAIPYPRSLWNTPVALQLGEITCVLYAYFSFRDILAENPALGAVILYTAVFRSLAILWLYAANSGIAAWLLCIYQGLQILYMAAGIALAYYQLGRVFPVEAYAFLLVQGLLRGLAIYLMLRALGKVREFRRLTQAAPQQQAAPDGVWR